MQSLGGEGKFDRFLLKLFLDLEINDLLHIHIDVVIAAIDVVDNFVDQAKIAIGKEMGAIEGGSFSIGRSRFQPLAGSGAIFPEACRR
jgi:hypothetical protein